MRYRCNDAAASGAAASLSRGRSVSEIKPDPKPARVRIVVCAVSKHRTAAQEPRARRPDPHPIRSAPEGSTRHCLFAVSSSETSQLSRWSNGVNLLTYNVFHTLTNIPHYIFRSLRLVPRPVSAAARAAGARLTRRPRGATPARRLSIIVCRGRSVGRRAPPAGAGPRAPPEPRAGSSLVRAGGFARLRAARPESGDGTTIDL